MESSRTVLMSKTADGWAVLQGRCLTLAAGLTKTRGDRERGLLKTTWLWVAAETTIIQRLNRVALISQGRRHGGEVASRD